MVGVDLRSGGRVDRLAAIARHVQIDAAVDDDIRIVRVDADLAEVHRPRILVVHFLPRRAAIIGSVETGGGIGIHARHQRAPARPLRRLLFAAAAFATTRAPFAPAPAGRNRPFDERVEDARPPAVSIDGNAAQRAVGPAVALHARPALAAVNRFPQTAAGTAAIHAARRPPPLIRRRVQNLVVRRVHHQIVRAGVVVDLHHLLPALSAVGRLVDSALAAGAPQAAGGGDEHDVVVARIDHDAVDVARRRQPHVRPRLAAVGRLVDAVAPRRALAVV